MSKFTSVKSDKVSNLINEQIKSAVMSRIFVTDDKLPSEREPAERFHASRISIREALKGLEAV